MVQGILNKVLLGFCFIGCVGISNAAPVVWTLNDTATGSPIIVASGTFTYDADSNIYSDVALKLSMSTSTFGINPGTSSANGFTIGTKNNTGEFTFLFDKPLSNAGGVVTGIGTNLVFSSIKYWPFTVSAVTPVPEPEASALLFAGLGMLALFTRKSLMKKSN